jgi:serine/threonine protein kinase
MADPSPPEHHDALPAGTRLGEFEIHEVVGVGGFGIVYRAHDHALQRTVALKEYLPVALAGRGRGRQVSIRSSAHAETFGVGLRSFVNEARLLAQFDHPALLKVYRFWEDNGTAYMVMPFYAGSTLQATRRAMAGPPAEAWMRAVLEPLLGALELMHGAQVFHRDIAPDNIILRPDGSPVLLDFGAARRVIGDRTQTLTAILKPNFAPIEQYAESTQFKQGPWTDLYALGAVVHFCATGRPPAPASVRVLHDELVPLPHLVRQGLLPWSERMAEAWQATLSLKPGGRPQSVAGLRLLLESAAAASDLLPTVVASPAPAAGSASAQAPLPPTVPVRRAGNPGGREAAGPAPSRLWPWGLGAAVPLVAALWWWGGGGGQAPVPEVSPVSAPVVAAAPPAAASEPAAALPAASQADVAAPDAASRPAVAKRPPMRPRPPAHDTVNLPASLPPQAQPTAAAASGAVALSPHPLPQTPPQTPRQACGSRVFVALYRCMQRQCERPALAAHPECVEWRRIEEGSGARR